MRDDWVQSGGEFSDGLEFWRFYLSGQFVHHFSVSEDWQLDGARTAGTPNGVVGGHERTLNTLNALFTMTEILEFARRLAFRGILEPAASIHIELQGMKGRRLAAPSMIGDYRSQEDTIVWSVTKPATELLGVAMDLAVVATLDVFAHFNWAGPGFSTFQRRQQLLLERGY